VSGFGSTVILDSAAKVSEFGRMIPAGWAIRGKYDAVTGNATVSGFRNVD
jgi:hypothetical protein